MPTVSDIQPQKKDPKRVNIFLDGKFAFGISLESKVVNQLKIGGWVSDPLVQKLILNDQVERLYDKAIKFLSFRPRSEKEVRDNLLQKLFKTAESDEEKKNFAKSVDTVVNKLKKLGQIDDRAFANWWYEQRVRFKKISPRLIKAELLKKGIEKDLVEEVVQLTLSDQLNLAKEAAKKKADSLQKFETKVFREKLGRYLASKGFDWDVIKKVVDTLSQKS